MLLIQAFLLTLLAHSSIAIISIPLLKRDTPPHAQDSNALHLQLLRRDTLRTYAKHGWTLPHESTLHKREVQTTLFLGDDSFDSTYYASIEVGTPPVAFPVQLDTGSIKFVIAGSTADSVKPKSAPIYDPTLSNTSSATGASFISTYLDGTGVTGLVFNDQVTFGAVSTSYNISSYNTTITTKALTEFQPENVSGLVGLQIINGDPTDEAFGELGIVGKLLAEKKLSEFGFAMESVAESTGMKLGGNGGSFVMGGVNASLHSGELQYTDVPAIANSSWSIPLLDIVVNGKSTGFVSQAVLIDSGTSQAYLPKSIMVSIFANIAGSSLQDDGLSYSYPCSTEVVVGFKFGENIYSILAQDFNAGQNGTMCTACLITSGSTGGIADPMILGAVFMKRRYTSFRLSPPAIGFAALANNHSAAAIVPSPATPSTLASASDMATITSAPTHPNTASSSSSTASTSAIVVATKSAGDRLHLQLEGSFIFLASVLGMYLTLQ